MLSAGTPENLGAGGVGGWRVVGWLSVPWGGGLDDNAAPLGPPFQYSLAPVKRA